MGALLLLFHRLPGAAARVPDGELLRRYAESRDETAFAELVRRNGPLVLRACRNVLRNSADADDAFQSTFLRLAHHAAALARVPSVAGWLHTVAVRSAGNIRRSAARRQKRESASHARPAHPASEDAVWAELRERIDAELARLPEVYRLPLLLCYVQGLSYADAAHYLGCSPGSLRGRLERGREQLRGRLGRWGLPAVLVAVGAPVPAVGAGLRESTLVAVRAAGTSVAGAVGGWTKWAAAAVLVTVAVVSGWAALRDPAAPLEPPPAAPKVSTPDVPEPSEKGEPVGKTDAAGDPLPAGALARFGSSRFHHGGNILRLAATRDGKWIVSSGAPGHRVWDLTTGREEVPAWMATEGQLTARKNPAIQCTEVAPAGDRVVAVIQDDEKPHTSVRDAITGEEIARVLNPPGAPGRCERLVLSADGKWLLQTHVTEDKNGREQTTLDLTDLGAKPARMVKLADLGQRNLFNLMLSADGRVASLDFDDTCEVWDLRTGAVRLKVPVELKPNYRAHGELSPNGQTLAVVQPGAATFQLWDVATKKLLPAPAEPFKDWVRVLCFSPDSKWVVGTNQGPLRVWDVATGKKVRDYGGVVYGAWVAAFTPDGKRLAGGCDDVYVVDVATGKPVHDFGGHTSAVWTAHFTPDGRLLTSAWSPLLWEPRTGRKLGGFPVNNWDVAASRDGTLIATSGTGGKVRLWSATTLAELRVIDLKGLQGYSVDFSPDGKELIVGGDSPGIRVFDVATGQPRQTIAAREATRWARFTPDGRRVVFGSRGDRVKLRVWDRAADKELFTFDAGKVSFNRPALSADGRLLAAGDWKGVARVFDLTTGKQVYEFDTKPRSAVPNYEQSIVYAVAFSPDGRLLATGGWDGVVRMWELATGAERFRLSGHRGEVLELAFSPDGALLVSGSGDRSVVTWDATGAGLPIDPKHQPKDAGDAWSRLADRDAAVGFGAVRYLASRPADAVPLLAKGLRPVPSVDPKVVAGLAAKLGSEDFVARENSEKELVALGEGAADGLRAALARATDAESRQRLTKLLAPLGGPVRVGDRLRAVRAVEALERAGTADARKALRVWAGGARGAELTEMARAAVARLDARASAFKSVTIPGRADR